MEPRRKCVLLFFFLVRGRAKNKPWLSTRAKFRIPLARLTALAGRIRIYMHTHAHARTHTHARTHAHRDESAKPICEEILPRVQNSSRHGGDRGWFFFLSFPSSHQNSHRGFFLYSFFRRSCLWGHAVESCGSSIMATSSSYFLLPMIWNLSAFLSFSLLNPRTGPEKF